MGRDDSPRAPTVVVLGGGWNRITPWILVGVLALIAFRGPIATALTILATLVSWLGPKPEPAPRPDDGRVVAVIPPVTVTEPSPPKIQLEQLNDLVTEKVRVESVLAGKDGWRKGLWSIRGDANLAIDMGKSETVAVSPDTKTITIKLPDPHVDSPRVDLERSKQWEMKSDTWIPFSSLFGPDSSQLQTGVYLVAQKLIESRAGKPEHVAEAKKRAEILIRELYAQTGWKAEVRWE